MHKSFKKFGLFSRNESNQGSINDKYKVVLNDKNLYQILKKIGDNPYQHVAKENQSKKSSKIKNGDKRETQSQSSKEKRHDNYNKITKPKSRRFRSPQQSSIDDTEFFFISPSAIRNERRNAEKLKNQVDTSEKPRHRSASPTYTNHDHNKKTSSPHSMKKDKDTRSCKSDDPNWLTKKEIIKLINDSKNVSHNTMKSDSFKKYFVFDQPSSVSDNHKHKHVLKPPEERKVEKKSKEKRRHEARGILEDSSNVSSLKNYIMGVLDKNLTEMLKPSSDTSKSYRKDLPIDVVYSRKTCEDRVKKQVSQRSPPKERRLNKDSHEDDRSSSKHSKRVSNHTDKETVSKKARKKLAREESEELLFYNGKNERKDILAMEQQKHSSQFKKKNKKRCKSVKVDAATEPEKKEFSKSSLKSQMLEVCQQLSEGTLEKLKNFKEPHTKETDKKRKLCEGTLKKIIEPNKEIPKNCDDKLYEKLQQVEKSYVTTTGSIGETNTSRNVKSNRRPTTITEFRPKLVEKLLQVIEIAPEEPILAPIKSKSIRSNKKAATCVQNLVEKLIPIIEIPPVTAIVEDLIERKKKSSSFRNYYKYDHVETNTKALTLSSASDSNRIYSGVSGQSVYSDKSSAKGATSKAIRKSRRDTPRSKIPILNNSKLEDTTPNLPANSEVLTRKIWARTSCNFKNSSKEGNCWRISRGDSARGIKTTTTECRIIEGVKAISDCKSNKPSTTTCDSVTTASSIPEDSVCPEIKNITYKLSQITSESSERFVGHNENVKTVSKIPQSKESKLRAKTRVWETSPQRGGGGSTTNSVSIDMHLDSPKNTTTMLLTKNFRDNDKVSRYHKWKMYSEQVRKKLLQQPQNLNSIPPQVMEVRFLTVTQNEPSLYDDLDVRSSYANSTEVESLEFYQEKSELNDTGDHSRSTFTKVSAKKSLKLQIEDFEEKGEAEEDCHSCNTIKRNKNKEQRSNLNENSYQSSAKSKFEELTKKNKVEELVVEETEGCYCGSTEEKSIKNSGVLGNVAQKSSNKKHESKFGTSQGPKNRSPQLQIQELAQKNEMTIVENKQKREVLCYDSDEKNSCDMMGHVCLTTEKNFRKHRSKLSQFKGQKIRTKLDSQQIKNEVGDENRSPEVINRDSKMEKKCEIDEVSNRKCRSKSSDKCRKATKIKKLKNVTDDNFCHSTMPKLKERREKFNEFEENNEENAIKLIPEEQFNELFELPVDDALNEILSENFHFLNKNFSYSAIPSILQSNLYVESNDQENISNINKDCETSTKAIRSGRSSAKADKSNRNGTSSWHEFYAEDGIQDICYEEVYHNLQYKKETDIILSSTNQEIADLCSAPGSEESGYATIKSNSFFQRPEIRMLLEPSSPPMSLRHCKENNKENFSNSSSISTVDCVSFKSFLNSSSNLSIGTNLSGNIPEVICFSSESERSSIKKKIEKTEICKNWEASGEKKNPIKREILKKSIKKEEKLNKILLQELKEETLNFSKEIVMVPYETIPEQQILTSRICPEVKKKATRKNRFFRFLARLFSKTLTVSCIKSGDNKN